MTTKRNTQSSKPEFFGGAVFDDVTVETGSGRIFTDLEKWHEVPAVQIAFNDPRHNSRTLEVITVEAAQQLRAALPAAEVTVETASEQMERESRQSREAFDALAERFAIGDWVDVRIARMARTRRTRSN